MMVRLVTADDHPICLMGLNSILSSEEGWEVVESCSNGTEAIEAVRRHQPDVAILNFVMPGLSGIEVARAIREEKLASRAVLLATHLKQKEVIEALGAGIQGILLKNMAADLIIHCIRKVQAGQRWLEMAYAVKTLEYLLRVQAEDERLEIILTKREMELVRMVCDGHRNREIASNLSISNGTVKVHLHNIYDKLKVAGRLALLRYVQEREVRGEVSCQ